MTRFDVGGGNSRRLKLKKKIKKLYKKIVIKKKRTEPDK